RRACRQEVLFILASLQCRRLQIYSAYCEAARGLGELLRLNEYPHARLFHVAAAGALPTAALVSWLCRRKRAFPWGRSGTENRVNPSRARASKLLRRLNPVL